MQLDFHYYATYCAAYLAGHPHEDSLRIAYCAQFVDCCSRTYLAKISGPQNAATTQLQLELMDSGSDPVSLQNITRIWASFHFLPGDLSATRKWCTRRYLMKYRLICNTNSKLLVDTVELARGKGLEATGLAMHVLADTWAHRFFAGTPSFVINNTNYDFYEIIPSEEGYKERLVRFNHNPASPDDPSKGIYTNSLYQSDENSVMNLGHGRAGHFPDYGFARYRYMPAWGGYTQILKDNPSDYMNAFCQMVYAMQCLRQEGALFEVDKYAEETVRPWADEIERILLIRQTDASADWKALAERISGCDIPDFDMNAYNAEYTGADKKDRSSTVLGRFIDAAVAQKSMVTNRIFKSGNLLAGFSKEMIRKAGVNIDD
ncbi:hypothetical protein SAMN02910456_00470 [Ruminococcaceae bacterium YRB3002]|nr:hypothetical protein SAMN02910456_00470 [Ruminococcaceae bacterium YRB3002]